MGYSLIGKIVVFKIIVVGSNPTTSVFYLNLNFCIEIIWRGSQVGKAIDFESMMREFESHPLQ